MTAMRITCPHCFEEIRFDMSLKAVKKKSRGPRPYNPGPEVDDFVIEAIDEKRFSFNTVSELLRDRGVPAARGGMNWYPASVRRLYHHALLRKERRR